MEGCKVVVIVHFHCLCMYPIPRSPKYSRKKISFKKRSLNQTEKLMLSSQERQVFVTYVSVCLHQKVLDIEDTKVFCDNQDLFNVCLKKSLFIKFYMSSWSVISAIIYHQTSCFFLHFNLMRNVKTRSKIFKVLFGFYMG